MKSMRSKVGIFWLIPIGEKQTLACFTQDIEKASHTDMYYDSTFEHIKCWPKVLHKYPELKNAPYEKYPRGRITFISKDGGKSGTFKLMADKKDFGAGILCAKTQRNLQYRHSV